MEEQSNAKVKIKLSELTDMYDIEDDVIQDTIKDDTKVLTKHEDWTLEETIEFEDNKTRKEFDEE